MKSNQLFVKTGLSVIGAATLLLYSCGGSENQGKTALAATNNPDIEKSSVVEKAPANTNELYAKGAEVYKQVCQACHQANGEGLPNAFPPLAKSDYLLADKVRTIKQVLKGSSGEITVNNQKFNGAMPPQNLTDEQVADVLNYVFHSWGNNGEVVTADEVKTQRGI